jgi:hypothetical protein
MPTLKHIKKIVIVTLSVAMVQLAFASFSFNTINDERNKNSKYSLKSLNNLAHKSLSFSLNTSARYFKGSQIMSQKNSPSGLEINSMIQYDNGKSTFVYPYKIKVKVPKDKISIPIK